MFINQVIQAVTFLGCLIFSDLLERLWNGDRPNVWGMMFGHDFIHLESLKQLHLCIFVSVLNS